MVDEVLVEDRIGLALDLHTGDPIGVDVVGFHVALATVKDKEATVLAMVHLGGGAGGRGRWEEKWEGQVGGGGSEGRWVDCHRS